MGLGLLIAMIGVPIAEIAVFIEAGSVIGFWPTIGVIILTAMIGTFFLRYQGLGVLSRVMTSLKNNEMPIKEMFEGLCLLFAGALLLTPGFITDGIGFILLVPTFRQALAGVIIRYFMKSGKMQAWPTQTAGHAARHAPHDPNNQYGPIIDGEYDEIKPEQDHLPPNNPSDPKKNDP